MGMNTYREKKKSANKKTQSLSLEPSYWEKLHLPTKTKVFSKDSIFTSFKIEIIYVPASSGARRGRRNGWHKVITQGA